MYEIYNIFFGIEGSLVMNFKKSASLHACGELVESGVIAEPKGSYVKVLFGVGKTSNKANKHMLRCKIWCVDELKRKLKPRTMTDKTTSDG